MSENESEKMPETLDDKVKKLAFEIERLLLKQTILEAEVKIIEEFLKTH